MLLPIISALVLITIVNFSASGELVLSSDEFINSDPGSRVDVSTHLNLSPWELHVLADLVFTLTSFRCPKLEEDLLSKYKLFILDSFKKAPSSNVQHEHFLPAYSKLIDCLEYAYEGRGVTDVDDDSSNDKKKGAHEVIDEVKSTEIDWILEDAKTTASEKVVNVPKTGTLGAGSGFSLTSARDWILNLLRIKRSTSTDEEPVMVADNVKVSESKRMAKLTEEEERQIYLKVYRTARQNVSNFFHGISKIIRKTCPATHRPDKVFMRKALLDMTSWATLGQHETIVASIQYFKTNRFLELLNECHKNL